MEVRIDSGIDDRDDQRAAPAAQEQQDHQRGQAGGDASPRGPRRPPRRARTATGRARSGSSSAGGSAGLDARQLRLDAVDDVERGGAAVLEDRSAAPRARRRGARCWSAAGSRRARARRRGCRPCPRPSRCLIGRSFSSVDAAAGCRSAPRRTRACRSSTVPVGRIRFCWPSAFTTSSGAEVLGLQRLGVDVHHHLARLAAVGKRHHRALHRGELGAHEAVGEVVQLVLGQRLARQRELQDRHASRRCTAGSAAAWPRAERCRAWSARSPRSAPARSRCSRPGGRTP